MAGFIPAIHVLALHQEDVDRRDEPGHDKKTNTLDVHHCAPILNHMVYYQTDPLDRTFAALADPTRRALLAQLESRDGVTVSELAKPFAM